MCRHCRSLVREGSSMRLLRTGFQVEIDDVVFIALDARRVFDNHFFCGFGEARIHYPGPGENFGIFDGGLVTDAVAFAGDAFDYVHGTAVEPAVEAEPGIVVEVCDVNNERVALKVSNRVTVVARVGFGVMSAAVGGHDAKRVSCDHLIEKNDGHSRRLNDGVRRPDSRNTAGFTVEGRIELALVGGEFLYLCEQLRLVGRLIGVGLPRSRAIVSTPVAWVGRTEPAHRRIGPGATGPKAVEVRMTVGKAFHFLS